MTGHGGGMPRLISPSLKPPSFIGPRICVTLRRTPRSRARLRRSGVSPIFSRAMRGVSETRVIPLPRFALPLARPRAVTGRIEAPYRRPHSEGERP